MNNLIEQEEKEYEPQYYVVKNHEEQYSIWPSYKPIPKGWETVGDPRIKNECLSYIDKVWTDMRPLSLRKKMAELEENSKAKEDDGICVKKTSQIAGQKKGANRQKVKN